MQSPVPSLLMRAGAGSQMVSHEIRTPLNAVNGATHLLLDTAPLTQEQLELLQLLEAGANHVVLIVEGACLEKSRACVPASERCVAPQTSFFMARSTAASSRWSPSR
jgi:hypothetical protein